MQLARTAAGLACDVTLTGVFPMLVTPFKQSGDLNFTDLRRLVDASLNEQPAGLSILGLGGESSQLTVPERMEVADLVLRQVDGRLPVIVGTTAQVGADAVRLAMHSRDNGAAALMVAPPYAGGSDADLMAHYAAIAKAAFPVAVMVQDAPAYIGRSLSSAFIADLASASTNVRYVKAEGFPVLDQVASVSASVNDLGLGVFGGNGGVHALDALKAGATGMIPGCECIAEHCMVFALWAAGREQEAMRRYRAVMPLLAFQMQTLPFFIACNKALLTRRGTLSNAKLRDGAGLSQASQEALFRYADEAAATIAAG